MTDAVMLERIAARRAELDMLEEQLVKQLAEVRCERDELVVAERVVQRISEQGVATQGFGEYTSLAPPEGQVGGRSVLLIPARADGVGPDALPADYQRLLTIVREAARSRSVRSVRCSASRSRCGASWNLCARS
jgi:hypothetical protein